MIDGRRVLAVVPARGGSKGIPRKNLRLAGGVPLVARAGAVARAVVEIDRAVVSTDDDEIARVAEAAGLDAPFRRPAALSGDRVGDVPVLLHALSACEREEGRRYDVVVMLQPTSPLRTPEQVQAALRLLADEDRDSVWTVSEVPLSYHPKKQLVLEEGRLGFAHEEGHRVVARQELEPTYVRNGVAYVLTRACLVDEERLLGRNAGVLVLEGTPLSIDSEEDLRHADALLRSRTG